MPISSVSPAKQRCKEIRAGLNTAGAIIFLTLLVPCRAVAGEPSAATAIRDSVIQRAMQLRLDADPYWHILLHYEEKPWGTVSLIDDPNFFLAPDGKTNPGAELSATIAALFDQCDGASCPMFCRFIGRYTWLDERLSLLALLPALPVCPEYADFRDSLQPRGMTLVMPVAFLNNPASMFGHALLTVETPAASRLRSYAVTYSAAGEATAGPLYILKGLFGLYSGFFSLQPYYEKVRDYSNLEQRDIWEFPLTLDAAEVERSLRHLWELQRISSRYYYLDENCSSNLRYLLDAARPSLRLSRQHRWWVAPLDIVKEADRHGLIADVRFRPSRATRIRDQRADLTTPQRAAVEEAIDNPISLELALDSRFSAVEQLPILNVVTELALYRASANPGAADHFHRLFQTAAALRSRLPAATAGTAAPSPDDPRSAHGVGGIALGVRQDRDRDRTAATIVLRSAGHDLLDPATGYLPGSQVELLQGEFLVREETIDLERLTLIRLLSLPSWDAMLRQRAWSVYSAVERVRIDEEDHRLFVADAGGGLAVRTTSVGRFYGLLEGKLRAGGALQNDFALGVGIVVGVAHSLNRWCNLHLQFSTAHYAVGHRHDSARLQLASGFRIHRRALLTVELSEQSEFGENETVVVVRVRTYF